MQYDIFNGDADGICALHQLRLSEPIDAAVRVTGVKRDIALLDRVEASAGDTLTVLDLGVEPNAPALGRILQAGARVRWFDHHHPGELPVHPAFEAHIDTAAEVCTSLLVDRWLGGRFRIWAVVAAFGDNLGAAARDAAAPLGLDEDALDILRELGECINYNGYGETLADLILPPDVLYRTLHEYADPFAFAAESPAYARIRAGQHEDLARAEALTPQVQSPGGAIYILPDAAWARRVSGVFANRIANASPRQAHAVLTPARAGAYTVSVRAPLARREGADTLCRAFAGGGGRRAAAGINGLPATELDTFARAFQTAWPAPV